MYYEFAYKTKSQMKIRLKKSIYIEVILVFIISIFFGTYLHWKAFKQPDQFHDNWRQVPHWTNQKGQNFQQDDLLIRYANFNTSPFGNFIYKTLAHTGVDILWGKINAVLFFSLAAMCIFLTGRAIGNRVSGWISTIIFLLFSGIFKNFVGGFMFGLSASFLIITVYIIHRKKWWWAIPLLIIESLVYPMVAVQSSVIFLLDYLFNDIRKTFNSVFWKKKYIPLIMAVIIGFLILSCKYFDTNHEFGKLVSRSDIGTRVEFTSKGRFPLIPVSPLWKYVKRYWVDSFHIVLLFIAYFFLGKRFFKLPRGLYALLLSGCLLYWLADIFLMKLYFPNRYVKNTFPIFMALAGGYWLYMIWKRKKEKKKIENLGFIKGYSCIFCLSFILLATGFYEFNDVLRPRSFGTYRYSKHDLYNFISSLPDRPMIAVHPHLGSEIPLMSGKSVLISKELSHPWWTKYWEIISNRTRDFFEAHYSTDKSQIECFINKYNIDYWIISKKHFTKRYLNMKKFYMQPFNDWIRRNLEPSEKSLLNQIPKSYRLFEDNRYYVVSSKEIVHWLESRI